MFPYLKRALALSLLLGAALPATAQYTQSGAQPVQGAGSATRGYPVNVRVVEDVSGSYGTAVTGNATTGTGLLGVGILGKYNTAFPTYTDGQFGNVQIGSKGQLFVTLVTGTGTGLTAPITPSDGAANVVGASVWAQNGVYNNATWNPMRGDATGAWIGGHSSLATGQVSIGTSSTLLVAARAGRQKVLITVGAANTCAFGNTGVTTSTGYPLQPTAGASLTLDSAAAIYAACSATTTVSYLEQY